MDLPVSLGEEKIGGLLNREFLGGEWAETEGGEETEAARQGR